MNGQLAALMALALHGNACLCDPEAPAPSLLQGNSAFRHVNSLAIVDQRGRWRPQQLVFTDTAEWYEHLRSEKVSRLSLLDAHAGGGVADEVAASVANGIRWALSATSRRGRRSWGAAWTVTDRDAPDQRVWAVRLEHDAAASTSVVAAPGVNLASAALDHALEDVAAFAQGHGLGNWRDRFEEARAVLHSVDPVLPAHADLAPPGSLSLRRARLLASAMTAWVFGGMGSWHDIGLDDLHAQGELARGTHRLYEAIMDSLLAVTNSAD